MKIKVSDLKITINNSEKVDIEEFQLEEDVDDSFKSLQPSLRILTLNDSNKDTLTVTEFAEEARITTQAVRKMISEDRLEAVKMGHQYLIQKEELFRYLQR